ncbi:hypothetical protein Sbs19_43740 [Sphingobium sp. BS19]|nr:hypothetical protein Sbs19_43740 [Sphingobium sp. BS19]
MITAIGLYDDGNGGPVTGGTSPLSGVVQWARFHKYANGESSTQGQVLPSESPRDTLKGADWHIFRE